MTRILIVEDDDNSIQAVSDILKDYSFPVTISTAINRDHAFRLLQDEFFDLMILDLKIPADETTEAKPEYGFAVFGHAKTIAPGMPVFILTGSSVEQFVQDILKIGQIVDVWGSGKLNTVCVLKKIDIDKLSAELAPYINGLHQLEDVELDKGGLTLLLAEERLLRTYAKRFKATQCIIRELNEGLSGTRVLRVDLKNAQGKFINHSVGKIGNLVTILQEKVVYDQHIVNLPPSVTPRLLTTLEFGAKATAAIFYGLASGHDLSLFQSLDINGISVLAIQKTAAGLAPWRDASQQGQFSIKEIRRLLLSDDIRDKLIQEYKITWSDNFENRNVQTNWGCIHGDCHGGNILVTNEGIPAIIDYGDITVGSLSLDPVALELSLFFHPAGPLVNSTWPDSNAAACWGSLDSYLIGCPYPDYVKACRSWATDVAGGNRAVAVSAYAFLLRQLKYSETNKRRILDLLEGAQRLFNSN